MENLEQQAQEEINAHFSGTNEETETETTEEETQEEVTDELEEDNEQEDSQEEDSKPKSKKEKTEDRFKKILSKKNSLETRVSELEDMLQDKDFYAQFPQAKEFDVDIKEKRQSVPWLSREEAFIIIAWQKGLSNRPKGIVGKPAPVEVKSTKDMSTQELTKFAIESGALNKALDWE